MGQTCLAMFKSRSSGMINILRAGPGQGSEPTAVRLASAAGRAAAAQGGSGGAGAPGGLQEAAQHAISCCARRLNRR